MWFQDAPFEGVVDNFSAGAARSSACARPSYFDLKKSKGCQG